MPRKRSDETSLLTTQVFGISDALCQLCEGLDYLHRRGTAHGDVKPANVLITPDGRVVILDFGIARDVRSEAEEDDGLSLLGTPGYLAPERERGDPVTPAADMYAVGVTLFCEGLSSITKDASRLTSTSNGPSATLTPAGSIKVNVLAGAERLAMASAPP